MGMLHLFVFSKIESLDDIATNFVCIVWFLDEFINNVQC